MSSALQFTLPAKIRLHSAFDELALQLASRRSNAKGTNGKEFSLNMPMRFGVNKTIRFSRAFLNTLAQKFTVPA